MHLKCLFKKLYCTVQWYTYGYAHCFICEYCDQHVHVCSRRSRDNTQSKHSLDVVAAAADWTHSMSPSFSSGPVLSRHIPTMLPTYLTLQYPPQRRRRKLSEPGEYIRPRTALIDLRRSVHAGQAQTLDGESRHTDVTGGVRYCMPSYGNTQLNWTNELA